MAGKSVQKQVKKATQKTKNTAFSSKLKSSQKKPKNPPLFNKSFNFWKARFSNKVPLSTQNKNEEHFVDYSVVLVIGGFLFFILLAYGFGRLQTSCATVFSSNIGTLKYVQTMVPFSQSFTMSSFFPMKASITTANNLRRESRLLLVNPQGQTLQVVTDISSNLANLDGKNVILTGQVSPCTQTISLDSLQNISPLQVPAQAAQ